MTATQTLLSEAIRHHQSGRLSEAERLYRSALAADPLNAEALHLFGLLAHQTGRSDIAIELIGQAISVNETNAMYHLNYGVALEKFGRLAESLDSYNVALRLQPTYSQAFYNRANVLLELGRLDESVASYEAAIRTNPDFTPAHIGRGKILHQLGLIDEALQAYDTALRIIDSAEAHFYRGNALQVLGRFEEAIASYDTAAGIKSGYVEALFNRGVALQRLGRPDEALGAYDQALLAEPKHLQTLLNRGNVFHSLARYGDALRAYDAALKVDPLSAPAHSGRGAALHDLGEISEALISYRNALEIDPNYAEAQSGRGAAQHDLGKLDEALASYKEAIRTQPGYAEAHMNRGLTLLLKGEFEEGWSEYAWRWKTRDSQSLAAVQTRLQSSTLWPGERGSGRQILVWCEQGLGDSIQFARFIPEVEALGWRVIFEVPQELVRLFRSINTPQTRVIASGNTLPECDAQCPLLDLPRILAVSAPANHHRVRYLQAEADLRSFWRGLLPSQGLRIGISWQGSPRHRNDRNRSVPLKYFSALSALDNVRLVSLQKGDGVAQLDETPAGLQIHVLGDEYERGGFHDTAALIMELDLVITVDTSIGHLAGALGQPVWIALPAVPDWRWQMHGSRSFWYPTARLFRQQKQHDWDSVFVAMARELVAEQPF